MQNNAESLQKVLDFTRNGSISTVIEAAPYQGADLQPARMRARVDTGSRMVRPTEPKEITMTTKTHRTARPATSATASSRKPVPASPAKAATNKTTKGIAASNRKTDAAKAPEILTTAQKLQAALDATAEKGTKSKAGAKASGKSATGNEAAGTKSATVMSMLRSAEGTTLDAIQQATGWQAHSVRGFLSGTVRKKQGMTLISQRGEDGIRRYRIDDAAAVVA